MKKTEGVNKEEGRANSDFLGEMEKSKKPKGSGRLGSSFFHEFLRAKDGVNCAKEGHAKVIT